MNLTQQLNELTLSPPPGYELTHYFNQLDKIASLRKEEFSNAFDLNTISALFQGLQKIYNDTPQTVGIIRLMKPEIKIIKNRLKLAIDIDEAERKEALKKIDELSHLLTPGKNRRPSSIDERPVEKRPEAISGPLRAIDIMASWSQKDFLALMEETTTSPEFIEITKLFQKLKTTLESSSELKEAILSIQPEIKIIKNRLNAISPRTEMQQKFLQPIKELLSAIKANKNSHKACRAVFLALLEEKNSYELWRSGHIDIQNVDTAQPCSISIMWEAVEDLLSTPEDIQLISYQLPECCKLVFSKELGEKIDDALFEALLKEPDPVVQFFLSKITHFTFERYPHLSVLAKKTLLDHCQNLRFEKINHYVIA